MWGRATQNSRNEIAMTGSQVSLNSTMFCIMHTHGPLFSLKGTQKGTRNFVTVKLKPFLLKGICGGGIECFLCAVHVENDALHYILLRKHYPLSFKHIYNKEN